jgi:hypothetical protein
MAALAADLGVVRTTVDSAYRGHPGNEDATARVMTDGISEPSQVEAFTALSRRRRWVWGLFLSYMPAAVVAGLINETIGNCVAIGWTIACAGATGLHGFSRCPRCGRHCFVKTTRSNPWASKCLHCGINLYRAKEELSVRPAAPENVGPPS